MTALMILIALSIFLMTIISGGIPFFIKLKNPKRFDFPIGEAMANGVFLGAGLIHMLPDAARDFITIGYDFPWPFVICGAVFLLFLLSEHINFFAKESNKNQSLFIAISSTIMLSIHSFFTGAAIGMTTDTRLLMVLFLAVLAHKWAASFSLSVYINKTNMSFWSRVLLFFIFSLMVPAGILSGRAVFHYFSSNQLIQPIFTSIAAGTFVYLGTLHGFKKILTHKECCNLYHYCYVIFGFTLMVVAAIWI